MSDPRSEEGREPIIDRAADWLNAKLLPHLGPPPLGPYGPDSDEPESTKPCPICRHPMNQHRVEVDPESGHTYLHHPADAFPAAMQVD